MKKKLNIIAAAMEHKQITLFITITLVAFGVYSLFVMPRQEFPDFTIRTGVVAAVMPGATSEQIENQLSVPIENYLFSFKEIDKKKTYSQAKEGVVYIFVELNEEVQYPAVFWSKLKHGLNNLKAELPSDLYGIYVNDDFGNTSAMLLSLSSDTRSYRELQDFMKDFESRLRRIESVSKLNRLGMQDEVINIYLQPEKLSLYGVKPMMIYAAFNTSGSTSYAGEIKNNKMELPIHISSKYRTVEDVGEQIVYSDQTGNVVRLKDIAVVKREMKAPDSYITMNKTKALILSIEMLEGNNIVAFGDDVDKIINDFEKNLPKDVKVIKIANQSHVVGESIIDFLKEFGISIFAVILVTMILLPLRVSSVAGSTIPISVLISLGILYLLKITLDTVTLAGLIIVLGMVVDNSIVIIDNYIEKLDHKIKPWDAAILAAKELFIPVCTATFAILSMFSPLAIFMTGMGKDFIQNFPIVIGVALGSSLLVSIFLVPYMCYTLIKNGLKSEINTVINQRKSILDYMQIIYDKLLELAFRYSKITILLGVLSIVFALILTGVLKSELFPKMERNQFAVEIYLPNGSSLHQTDSIVKIVEDLIIKDKRITDVASFIGGSSPRFHTLYAPNMPSKNYAQMIINVKDNKSAVEVLDEYSKNYSNVIPNAHIRFKQMDMQATKAPIEVRISGDSIKALKAVAEQVTNIFRKNDKTIWIRNDYEEARQCLVYDINYNEASRLGFSKFDISMFMTIAQKGMPITKLWEDDYPVDVQLTKFDDKSGKEISQSDTYIPSLLMPSLAPLRQFTKARTEWSEGQIVRRNGVRTITVLVDVNRGELASEVLSQANSEIVKLKLPERTSISYGGEKESEGEQYPPLVKALVLGMFLIFLILLFQFKNIKIAIIIMTTMPLSFFGAFLGLYILKLPFGMTTFIGILGLCGVVVRNGIILIDFAIKLREEQNLTIYEAALAAGKRRMRPIFLTSAAAAVGVIPMIASGSLLWSPLATVICFGLIFSMILTLLILPVLYWMVFKNEDKKACDKNAVPTIAVTLLALLFASQGLYAQNGGSYSLEKCKELAIKNNVKVKNAVLEIKASEETQASVYTKYFPQISASATGIYSFKDLINYNFSGANLPVYDGNLGNLGAATNYAYVPGMKISLIDKIGDANILITQPVYAGGRISTSNDLAQVGRDVNVDKYNIEKYKACFEVEKYYWQIVSLQGKYKTTEFYDRFLNNLLKDVNSAVNAGLTTKNDALKVSLKLNELHINQLKLNNGISMLKEALCQHIGETFDNNLTLSDTANSVKEPSSFYIDSKNGVENRFETSMQRNAVKADELQSKLKKGEFLPEFGVGFMYDYFNIMKQGSTNGFLFASLNVPISAWWGGSHELEERQIKEEIMKNTQKETSELLALDISKAWKDLDETYKQIQLGEEAVTQAQENFKITESNYKAGTIAISDFLEAQALLEQSQDQLSEFHANYNLAKAKYLQTVGKY